MKFKPDLFMNEDLNNILKNYLNFKGQNNALFINGEWGVGKSYYLQNEGRKIIEEPGRHLIYISLNGLDSLEQVVQILFEAGRSKKGKNRIFKTILSGLKYLNGIKISLFGVTYKFSSISIAGLLRYKKRLFDPAFHVICIDDLERIQEPLTLAKVFGIINSVFIESSGFKIIFIGDGSKDPIKTQLSIIGEKIIGWQFTYIPDIPVVFSMLIEKQNYHEALITILHPLCG